MAVIESFEDLEVWNKAQIWAVNVYKVTKTFPLDERYGMTSQIRRSVSSISANIAEGFGRKTNKDKLNFYTIAYGSVLETKNFLYLAEELDYINKQVLESLIKEGVIIQKLLNAFMRPLK